MHHDSFQDEPRQERIIVGHCDFCSTVHAMGTESRKVAPDWRPKIKVARMLEITAKSWKRNPY
jgi:hypothetical protein